MTTNVTPMVVNRPYTDLCRLPIQSGETPLLETQLLYGELVFELNRIGDWSYVSAPEQPKIDSEGSWKGYPGWVKSNHLTVPLNDYAPNLMVTSPWATLFFEGSSGEGMDIPIGSRLSGTAIKDNRWELLLPDGSRAHINKEHLDQSNPKEWRQNVLNTALTQIGTSYYWGGRTFQTESADQSQTGIDCSGLINLCYRIHFGIIPRNAFDMMMATPLVPPKKARPGDLIFSGEIKEDHPKIDHVMLYYGDNLILEATSRTGNVRLCKFEDRLDASYNQICRGRPTNAEILVFGDPSLNQSTGEKSNEK